MPALRLIALLLPLALLTGCISLPKNGSFLTNHIITTIDESRCMTASRWGPMAITGDVNASECEALLEGQRLRLLRRLLQEAAPQPQPQGGKA